MRPALLLAALALAAGAAGAASIEAKDDRVFNPRYEPATLRAAPGEAIRVANTGSDRHTLTSVDGAFAEVDVASGASNATAAPLAPGDYRFYCRYHASAAATEGMVGVLRVASPEAGAARSPLPAAAALLGLALAAWAAGRNGR